VSCRLASDGQQAARFAIFAMIARLPRAALGSQTGLRWLASELTNAPTRLAFRRRHHQVIHRSVEVWV
jgi:hypothetical protein